MDANRRFSTNIRDRRIEQDSPLLQELLFRIRSTGMPTAPSPQGPMNEINWYDEDVARLASPRRDFTNAQGYSFSREPSEIMNMVYPPPYDDYMVGDPAFQELQQRQIQGYDARKLDELMQMLIDGGL